MAITQALANALSGLNAVKRSSEVTSSNIANAMTPGYGVREIALGAREGDAYGSGVRIRGVTRQSDPFVLAERRLTDAEVGYHSKMSQAASQVEEVFGRTGSKNSLATRVSDLEASLISAASEPSATNRLDDVSRSLDTLTGEIRGAANKLSSMRERAEGDIAAQVDTLNASLKQIDRLNDDIFRYRVSGHPTAGLIDQRQQVIDSISEIVPVRQLEREGGRIALVTALGETLVDHRPREIGFETSGVIAPQMKFGGGVLQGLTIDGRPAPGGTAVGLLKGGSLEASFDIRDKVTVNAQENLDQFAANLMKRLSDPTVDATMTGSGDGLLISAGTPTVAAPEGLANVIKINPRVAVDGGKPFRFRDGIAANTPGAIGNSALLQAWGNALSDARPATPGGRSQSVAGHAASISADLSAIRVRSERDMSFASSKRTSLHQKELAHGVDTDKEMQSLMRLEQAYAANAKVITVVGDMMRRIMEI